MGGGYHAESWWGFTSMMHLLTQSVLDDARLSLTINAQLHHQAKRRLDYKAICMWMATRGDLQLTLLAVWGPGANTLPCMHKDACAIQSLEDSNEVIAKGLTWWAKTPHHQDAHPAWQRHKQHWSTQEL